MSSFDATTEPRFGNLTVDAPLGVGITITSGPFEKVASGYFRLSKELPEGIYTIRWHVGANTSQQVLRLTPGADIKVSYDHIPDRKEADLLRNLILSTTQGASTGLVLLVSRSNTQKSDRLERDFWIRSAGEHSSARSDITISPSVGHAYSDDTNEPGKSCSVLSFAAGPGTYFLRYKTVDQFSVEQTVNIYPQRMTIGLLDVVRASRPERDKNQARFRAREGVDPCSGRFLSISPIDYTGLEEALRLSSILLHALQTAQDKFDPALLRVLNMDSDPYLLTYATAIELGTTIQAAIAEGGRSKGPSDVFRVGAEAADIAERLISYVPEFPGLYNPDALCAQWRLALGGWGNVPQSFTDLKAPPVLERSWRWATAWSVENPGTAAPPKAVSAAASAHIAASPWVVWRRSPSEPVEIPSPGLSKDLLANTITLVEALLSGRGAQGWSSEPMKPHKETTIPSIDLAKVSKASSRLVANILRLAESSDIASLLTQKLAVLTNTPAITLAGQVEKALREISTSNAGEDRSVDLIFTSDPHKNKFGGSPVQSERELALERIEQSDNPEFLSLTIVVRSLSPARPLQGTVKFFLHPTFNPTVEIARVIDGRAVLICYAMGGFTLGAETSDGVQLELDLALDHRLPEWFRAR